MGSCASRRSRTVGRGSQTTVTGADGQQLAFLEYTGVTQIVVKRNMHWPKAIEGWWVGPAENGFRASVNVLTEQAPGMTLTTTSPPRSHTSAT